jgi:hypothetical protein
LHRVQSQISPELLVELLAQFARTDASINVKLAGFLTELICDQITSTQRIFAAKQRIRNINQLQLYERVQGISPGY